MKELLGFESLLQFKNEFPRVGWIFVNKGTNRSSAEALESAMFYIPENEDDEFYGEDNLDTFLEFPIFIGILEARERHLSRPSAQQYLDAAIYYLENDDFLE